MSATLTDCVVANAALARPDKPRKPSSLRANCVSSCARSTTSNAPSNSTIPRDYRSCTLCDQYFVDGDLLDIHYKECLNERSRSCKDSGRCQSASCGSGSASRPTETTSTCDTEATRSEVPYCEACDSYFSSETSLYHHNGNLHSETMLPNLCPICSVPCVLSEHLTQASHHRSLQSPEECSTTNDLWPRPCFECDAILLSPDMTRKHRHAIAKHNQIMHERQAECAADEWQRYCWPCDQYFASEPELTQHQLECLSPLKYLTRMEGELLAASFMTTEEVDAHHYSEASNADGCSDDEDSDAISQLEVDAASNPFASTSSLHTQSEASTEEHSVEPEPELAVTNDPTSEAEPEHYIDQSLPAADNGVRRSYYTEMSPNRFRPTEIETAIPLRSPLRSTLSVGSPRGRGQNNMDVGSPAEEEALPSYLATIYQDVPSSPSPNRLASTASRRMANAISSYDSSGGPLPVARLRRTRGDSVSEAASSATANTYECPLCFESENELSNIPCGHVFCTSCIMELLERDPHCPLCRSSAEGKDMRKVFLS